MEANTSAKAVVLVGGGHAHIQVIRDSPLQQSPHVKLVLVSESPTATYSGLLPSVLSGRVAPAAAIVNLAPLCAAHSARFVHAVVIAVNPASKFIHLATSGDNGAKKLGTLRYDVLSLDVGSRTRELPTTPGDRAIIINSRPIAALPLHLTAFQRSHARHGAPARALVAGGGAAAVELALALVNRLAHAQVVLVAPQVLPHAAGRTRAAVCAALRARGVRVEAARVAHLDAATGRAELSDGRTEPFDVALVATGAAPPALLAHVNLPVTDAGWLRVGRTLQSVHDEDVFGAGDCISLDHARVAPPKAGVFAVRQGPVLAINLRCRALALARAPVVPAMRRYEPQTDFLTLLATGDGRAIGSKYGLVFKGSWVFRLKMYIDEAWQRRFRVPAVAEPDALDAPFEGSPPEAAAALLGGDDMAVSDCFEVQLSVLKRMDADELFRDAVIHAVNRK